MCDARRRNRGLEPRERMWEDETQRRTLLHLLTHEATVGSIALLG